MFFFISILDTVPVPIENKALDYTPAVVCPSQLKPVMNLIAKFSGNLQANC